MSRAEAVRRLRRAGLEATDNRARTLAAVLDAPDAPTPPELLERLGAAMNRVTLYRILDLLVEHGLVERHSGAGRAFHYCAGRGHGHFHCTRCGRMQCVRLEGTGMDLAAVNSSAATATIGRVEGVELRLDGVCRRCLDRPAAT